MLYAVFFYSFLDGKLNGVNVNECDIKSGQACCCVDGRSCVSLSDGEQREALQA
jgi:hypothetical protein